MQHPVHGTVYEKLMGKKSMDGIKEETLDLNKHPGDKCMHTTLSVTHYIHDEI